jgi:hypothetical protein
MTILKSTVDIIQLDDLYKRGVISKTAYEDAKIKIISVELSLKTEKN